MPTLPMLGIHTEVEVFSRGIELPRDEVDKHCAQINSQARGAIGVSAHLSPNTLVAAGEHDIIATGFGRDGHLYHLASPDPAFDDGLVGGVKFERNIPV